jgi:transposase
MQTPEQKIKELEEKLKRLERHNQYLETRLDKEAILDRLIDLVEEEYLIPVKKTPSRSIQYLNKKNKKSDKLSLRISRDQPAALL